MKCHLSSLSIAAAALVLICPVVARYRCSGKNRRCNFIIRNSQERTGPFDTYCDGYGYVSIITLHAGKAPKAMMLAGQNGERLPCNRPLI
jgi:hypothetical protein